MLTFVLPVTLMTFGIVSVRELRGRRGTPEPAETGTPK
jgi:hypothetical protein